MKKIFWVIILLSCKENHNIQKPLAIKKDTFLDESAIRSKIFYKKEDIFIENYVNKNNLKYLKSNYGFWYKIEDSKIEKINKNDTISIFYIVKTLQQDTLYQKKETFIVDKSDIIKGLNESVKFLGEKETGFFIIPSYMAYGFLGDNNKINSEIPLIFEIEIIKVRKSKY